MLLPAHLQGSTLQDGNDDSWVPVAPAPRLLPLAVRALVLLLLRSGLAENAVHAEGVLAWTARLALVLGCTLLIVCTLLLHLLLELLPFL